MRRSWKATNGQPSNDFQKTADSAQRIPGGYSKDRVEEEGYRKKRERWSIAKSCAYDANDYKCRTNTTYHQPNRLERKKKSTMMETGSENACMHGSTIWKNFLRKHWNMVVLFVVAAVLASIGAVFVCLWFVGDAQSTGLVPTTLGLWTMGHLVTFLLHLIFWEVLLIGIPVIVAAVAGWLWWRRLPDEERKEYHVFGTRSRAESGGGGLSLLFFVVFCIKVFTDGNWHVAFATWTFDYLVYACLSALIWMLVIFGIPIGLGIIWWIHHEMKKKP